MASKKSTQDVEKKPKKNRRNQFKYPALEPSVNLVTRKEEIEDLASYAKTLPPEAREWLNSYAEEEICANFNHKGPKLNKTKSEKKKVYDRNNARNRCIFTREKAQNKLTFLEKNEDLDKEVDK